VAQPTLSQPKSALVCLPLVHSADLKGQERVDTSRTDWFLTLIWYLILIERW
jgi:hypothetical protein